MTHSDILSQTVARLTAAFQGEARRIAQGRLVGALRAIPPDQRAKEAEMAILRLGKQETLEAKLKALSDEELDNVQIG